MNDVDLIPGINFKTNKLRVRKQISIKKQKNKLLNINIILLIIFVIFVIYLDKKISDSALNSCQAKGNSYEYCINHL